MTALLKSVSEQTLLISNRNLKIPNQNHVNLITIQKKREKFLLASNVAILLASNEVHTQTIDIKLVVLKMLVNQNPSISTWVKLLLRARIIHPSASHHRKRDLSRPLLRIMITGVTFVMIQIIYQMHARKRTRICNMLKAS